MSNHAQRPRCKMIADSITPWGHRLCTVQVEHHRPILAETNTHRVITKSSASSRAIPVMKQIRKVEETPWFPNVWASEKKGMQGGPPLEGKDYDDALLLFDAMKLMTTSNLRTYIKTHPIGDEEGATDDSVRLHKSWLNRLLEPFMGHTALWTSTAWENFFHQRAHEAAMPEFRLLAEAVRDCFEASTPRLLNPGQYHLPYVWDDRDLIEMMVEESIRDAAMRDSRSEFEAVKLHRENHPAVLDKLKAISTARCARTSYETQEGKRDPEEDLKLYHGRLAVDDPMHATPMEHVATPAGWNERKLRLLIVNGRIEVSHGPTFPEADFPHLDLVLPVVGNLLGWQQHRIEVEFARQIRSFT